MSKQNCILMWFINLLCIHNEDFIRLTLCGLPLVKALSPIKTEIDSPVPRDVKRAGLRRLISMDVL